MSQRLELRYQLAALLLCYRDLIQRRGAYRLHLPGLGDQMIACPGWTQEADGDIQRHGLWPVGIAGRGKGDVRQAENDAAVGDAVEIQHLIGDQQRGAAVTGLDCFEGSA